MIFPVAEALPAGHTRLCHWRLLSARGRLVDSDPVEGFVAEKVLSWAVEHCPDGWSPWPLFCVYCILLFAFPMNNEHVFCLKHI